MCGDIQHSPIQSAHPLPPPSLQDPQIFPPERPELACSAHCLPQLCLSLILEQGRHSILTETW